MQRLSGNGNYWMRPPPEQGVSNSFGDTVQGNNNNHHQQQQQFERRNNLTPVNFQASQSRAAASHLPDNPSNVNSQYPSRSEPYTWPHFPQNPHIQTDHRGPDSWMMPPFSRPPPPQVGLGDWNLRAASTSCQSQDNSHGPPRDVPVFDEGLKYYKPQQRYDQHASPMTKLIPISVESPASLDITKQPQEHSDEKWVKKFEESILKRQPSQETIASKKKSLKVGDLARAVCKGETLVRHLESLEQKGQLCNGEEDWNQLLKDAHIAKESLSHIISKLKDDNFIQQAKKLIDQRRMKRRRAKKRKKDLQHEKREELDRRREEEAKIDAWRDRLQQEVEQQKREKVMQSEADSVLSEVHQKQSESLRMLQLLEKVSCLRQARLKKMAAHGQTSSPDSDHHFTTTRDRVEEVVRSQLKEYELEERTLCVILEGTASYKSAVKGSDVNIEDALKKIYFGDRAPLDRATLESFTMADRCLETLVRRRQDWDQYICEDESPVASSIPFNWVLPPTNPSSSWATYLTSPIK